MKKICNLFLSLLMLFILTGCVKYDVNMAINEDKSVDFEMTYGFDTSMMDLNKDEEEIEEKTIDENEEYVEDEEDYDFSFDDEEWDLEEDDEENESTYDVNKEDYKYLEKYGFKVEEYEKDNVAGIKISKNFKNIEELLLKKSTKVDFNSLFEKENEKIKDFKLFSKKGSKYVADLVFDFSTEEEDDTDYSSMVQYFNMKYTVTLPNKAISNNADEVSKDGKTLTWNLKYGEKNEVKYSFLFNNCDLFYILIGCGISVALIIIVVIIIKKNKSKQHNNTIKE